MPRFSKGTKAAKDQSNGSAGGATVIDQPERLPAPGSLKGDAPANRLLPNGRPDPKLVDPWEYMTMLTADLWQDTIGYLYRIAPTLSRRSLGRESYLLRFFEPITEEWVKQTYGGKEFRMDLKIRSTGEKIYTAFRFAISATPILQPGEEIEQPNSAPTPSQAAATAAATANTTEVMALVKNMVTDLMNQRDAAQQEGKAFDFESAFDKSVQLLARGSNAAIDVILEQSKRVNSDGGGSAVLAVIMPMLLELIKQMGQRKDDPIMAKIIDKAFAAPPDPLEQLDKMLSIAEKLRGGTSGTPRGGWAGVAEKLLDRAPELLTQGKAIVDSAAQARAVQVRQPAALPAIPAPPPPITGTVISELQTNANPIQPANESAPQQAVIANLKATIANMVLDGDSGELAAQTADLIDSDYADELRRTLQENPLALASDPILSQCRHSPNLRTFITEFLAWFEKADQETQKAEATASAPPPA